MGSIEPNPVDASDIDSRTPRGRRLLLRWLGWGAVGVLAREIGVGVIRGYLWSPHAGAFGGVIDAGQLPTFVSATSSSNRLASAT